MENKKRTWKKVSALLICGMLASVPTVRSEAAVITSNATDKIAVVFNENTAYSAGDYVTHGGEMYICTGDIQGAWSEAEASFMQITKNQELGQSEDLAAAYDDSVDPSQEKSLMAFVANAWQKIKVFLGVGNQEEVVEDAANYKSASVSAKLNFLERQNQDLGTNLDGLRGQVNDSFTSVSSGKGLLAETITDLQGTNIPRNYTFQQFSEAIRALAQSKYKNGYDTGHKEGYDTGNQEGYATGNKAGHDAGYSEGYNAGVTFADGRVNENSASYREAAGKDNSQMWECDVHLERSGPDKEAESFTKREKDGDEIEYFFCKQFPGRTVLGAYVTERAPSPYGEAIHSEIFLKLGSGYQDMSTNSIKRVSISENSISWGWYRMNQPGMDYGVDLHFRVLLG